ncbi:hypothetical protein [Vibrio sp. 99-8-1]|uniref:hypothetical protein n=1 Tax=Vibrio sp. 99-8-1 TaxID=2607602 RepID=UPI001493DBEC|nr:hypothetical protein [Vibrio sp. 99-8-1]NOI66929.1 hypothetical protein [Vibrio sp. 99-8-1]
MSIISSMQSGVKGVATSPQTQNAQVNNAIPTQTTPSQSPPKTLNVADEVATITGKNSLAMRSAQANGLRSAASRGLQNSTIGSEAAQRAMVDAALPMAQQNVQQRQQTTLQDDQQRHQQKMQEDSVRANTVGEYLKLVGNMSTGFMDAYKDIQASEIPADQKKNAITDLVKKRDEQLSSIKDMFSNLNTTKQDWTSFPDLI